MKIEGNQGGTAVTKIVPALLNGFNVNNFFAYYEIS